MFFSLQMRNPTKHYSQLLKSLAWGPSKKVKTYTSYIMNGFWFHTRDRGEEGDTYNDDVPVQDDTFQENVDVDKASTIDVETYFEELQNDETEKELDSYVDSDEDIQEYDDDDDFDNDFDTENWEP
ncbi:hypothetical protein M9H77_30325 [Catharanthus roseus]|uniref:Uncharacterized protein n=1 Tax=Catharanthus roseus TaxID=4058 RepID=A0ACC0A170_CATRO|nr:hypothetical protein M9H77_30325 [Catharanthus roseus]